MVFAVGLASPGAVPGSVKIARLAITRPSLAWPVSSFTAPPEAAWKSSLIDGGKSVAHFTLGIETSCDETSAAVVEDGRLILSNVIFSQVDLHARYGGVVPEIASRRHLEVVVLVIEEALRQSGVARSNLDLIAVTYGPGLVGPLLVGVSLAKALAYGLERPLIGVNHLEGHIFANFLAEKGGSSADWGWAAKPSNSGGTDSPWPLICLVASGGHSDIIYMTEPGEYELLGKTRDDAAGEAFDKVARLMGLGYPGGPLIDRLAQEGNAGAVPLPRAHLGEGSLDFSFSGLKTAVWHYLQGPGRGAALADLAASFQLAVADALVEKTLAAASQRGVKRILLAGGVAANSALRRLLTERAAPQGITVSYPPPLLCTDNGAMIAGAGFYAWRRGERSSLELNAVPNLVLGDR